MNNTEAYRCVLEASKQYWNAMHGKTRLKERALLLKAILKIERRVARMEARLAHVRTKLAKKKHRPKCLL